MKLYKSKKKSLRRLAHINTSGFVKRTRDTGSLSRKRFQKQINAGWFDPLVEEI